MEKKEKFAATISEKTKEYANKIRTRTKEFFLREKGFGVDIWRNRRMLVACNEGALHRMLICSIVLFCIWLLWALWLKFNNTGSILDSYYYFSPLTLRERFSFDINPFKIPIFQWWRSDEILANSIVFAPFGALFNMLAKKKNIWRDLAICFGISLSIELLQLFTTIGVFATIDLVTNTFGYLFGYAAYELIFKKLSVKTKVWFLRIINVCVFIWLCFAAVNTARNMDVIIGIITRTL